MTDHASEKGSAPDETIARRKPRRWKAVVLGLVILVCGALIGSAATIIHLKHVFGVVHTPGAAAERITDHMRRQLDLSDEQAAKVRAILTKRETALRGIVHEMQPKLEKQLQLAKEEVAAVLDPEQARRWRTRFNRLEDRWKRKWLGVTSGGKREH
jgi:Spy/CpxP family protein refolding chaperone